jgi:hypothetical protein
MVKRSKTDAVGVHVAAFVLALAIVRAIHIRANDNTDPFIGWVPWMLAFGFLTAAFFASQYWVGPDHPLRDPVTEAVALSLIFFGWFGVGCVEFAYSTIPLRAFLLGSVISLIVAVSMAHRARRLASQRGTSPREGV